MPDHSPQSPTEMPVKLEATVASGVDNPHEGPNTTVSLGLCQRENYCLLIWVTHNVDSVLALDSMVPAHIWSQLIA